ncbi:MAG TPA: ornithine cyclodeaminase family protein, partial [Candidatus Omnitrophota bacterium]|nr:ornithine cyclodeaminase family protein [Candidatus Omnitrophota bacterium]
MTLILSENEVRKLVSVKEAISVIEDTFREYGKGRTQMPPKIYLYLPEYKGDFRAMPGYVKKTGACCLKWVNVHTQNKRFSMPTVMATIILSDPKNGYPLAILGGSCITALRTGAAGALAAKYLARKDSKSVALVGCGIQAEYQLKALNEVFKINKVDVWGKTSFETNKFISKNKLNGVEFSVFKKIEDCVKGADIVITTTPSRRPIVKLSWLKNNCHINAIGADAAGKQELD